MRYHTLYIDIYTIVVQRKFAFFKNRRTEIEQKHEVDRFAISRLCEEDKRRMQIELHCHVGILAEIFGLNAIMGNSPFRIMRSGAGGW